QVAVVGPQGQRLVEDGKGLPGALVLRIRPVQRAGRLARPGPEAGEALPQEGERLFRLLQVAGGGEVGPGEPLVLVVEAGGKAVQLQGLTAAALVPAQAREAGQGTAVAGSGAEGSAEEVDGRGMLAGVGGQLLGVGAPEDWVGALPATHVAQQRQAGV